MTPETRGIACPRCQCTDLRAYRTTRYPGRITRVRICRACGRRVVTHERLPTSESAPPGAKVSAKPPR